jgi:hypothetical protein
LRARTRCERPRRLCAHSSEVSAWTMYSRGVSAGRRGRPAAVSVCSIRRYAAITARRGSWPSRRSRSEASTATLTASTASISPSTETTGRRRARSVTSSTTTPTATAPRTMGNTQVGSWNDHAGFATWVAGWPGAPGEDTAGLDDPNPHPARRWEPKIAPATRAPPISSATATSATRSHLRRANRRPTRERLGLAAPNHAQAQIRETPASATPTPTAITTSVHGDTVPSRAEPPAAAAGPDREPPTGARLASATTPISSRTAAANAAPTAGEPSELAGLSVPRLTFVLITS